MSLLITVVLKKHLQVHRLCETTKSDEASRVQCYQSLLQSAMCFFLFVNVGVYKVRGHAIAEALMGGRDPGA